MKITILNTQNLFVRGGAEYLADSLAGRLRGRGHRVAQVRVPFRWTPPAAVTDHILACQLLDLGAGDPDLVIALKFPAYLAPFPNKKLWLLHQYRQAYELWGTPFSDLPDTPTGRGLRDLVRRADRACLGRAKAVYTNSKIVARRLKVNTGLDADDVLYPPLDRPELFQPGESGAYFFYPSRMNAIKRQHVAIEAMRHVRSNFRLVLAGKPDGLEYGARLAELIERYNLTHKVRLLGWVTEEEKARWMAGACGALYLPFDEDSYGYVTLEAFHCHKPVLTFSDSGGTDELIEDGRNGLILEPTPEALAAGMEAVFADANRARAMGAEAGETLVRYRINWDQILDRLAA
jgi:glycosyltransferase involved in cell wall biosynthesis